MAGALYYIDGQQYEYGTPEYEQAKAARQARIDERMAANRAQYSAEGLVDLNPNGRVPIWEGHHYGASPSMPWYDQGGPLSGGASPYTQSNPRRQSDRPNRGGGRNRGGMNLGGGMGGGAQRNATPWAPQNLKWENTQFGSNNSSPISFGSRGQASGDMAALTQALAKNNWG